MRWLLVPLLLLIPVPAEATLVYCTVSGVVHNADGSTCKNCQVTFSNDTPQNPQGSDLVAPSIVPLFTDGSGNLPPTNFAQLLNMTVQVMSSLSQPVTIPQLSAIDISQLFVQGTIPPPGFPICSTPPTVNQIPIWNGTFYCPGNQSGGGGSSAFSALTSSTNTTAAMVVGTGASLAVSGSGTIAATTAAALAANGTNCSAGSFPLGVDAAGNSESCTTLASSNAGTATALAANGSNCSAGSFPLGVDASGNSESCTALSASNVGTATALAADGTNCSANQAAGGVDASGNAQSCIAPLLTPGAVTTNQLVKFSGTGGQATTNSACTEAAGTLTCTTFSGAVSGNATTATALAANGTNCTAGNYPLGVDASGNAESCTAIPVTSVFGRTGAVVAATNDYTWAQVNKATSSIADITTRSAGDLSSGTLSNARLAGNTLLDGSVHTDTAAGTVARGDIIVGNSTPAWSRLAIGTTGKFLRSNGTDVSWQVPLGSDISGAVATATALAANGTNCSAASFPLGVDASGNAESCTTLASSNAGTATALAADGANCSANQAAGGVDASGAAQSCIAPLILAGISGGQSALGSTASATSTTETLTLAANAATGSAIAGQGNLTPIIVNSPLSLFPTGTLTVGTGGGNNALVTLDPTVTMAGTTQFYGIDFSPSVTVVAAGEVVQGFHGAATVGTTVSNTNAWQIFADSSIYTQTAAAKAPTLRTFSDGGTTACNFAGTCTTATLIPSAFKNAHLYWAEGGSAVWQASPTLNGIYGFWDNPVFKADSGSTLTSSRYGVQIDDVAVQGTGTVTVPNDIGVNCSDLTAGSTTDVCLQSAVTSGTGKFGINAQGTAQNRLLGNTIVGGTTSTTPAGTLNVQEPTAVTNTTPNEAFRVESNATNDFPNTKIFQSRGTAAAGATQTMDLGLSTADHEYLVEARVICHCTSGATCATTVRGGAAILVGTFVNVAGTVTQIGATTSVHSQISLTLTSITLTASTPSARVTFISAAAAANTCHVTWLESDVGS